MRVLVTGSGGMLGRRLLEEASARGHFALGLDQPRWRLEHPEEALALLRSQSPDLIIHTAALTDVDGCESREEEALQINGGATKFLADAAQESGWRFLYISTDYVFDGKKGEPYEVDDPTGPATVYGRSKLLGEEACLSAGGLAILLSWLFGPQGRNFVRSVVLKLKEGESLKVVDDQKGRPTFTRDAAQSILALAESAEGGIYHLCNHGETTWFDFARRIAQLMGVEESRVMPCSSEEYPTPALRPADSRLSTRRLEAFRHALPDWENALERYLEEEGWI